MFLKAFKVILIFASIFLFSQLIISTIIQFIIYQTQVLAFEFVQSIISFLLAGAIGYYAAKQIILNKIILSERNKFLKFYLSFIVGIMIPLISLATLFATIILMKEPLTFSGGDALTLFAGYLGAKLAVKNYLSPSEIPKSKIF